MPITLSYSQIATWKRCHKKWQYRYQDRLHPIETVYKMALGTYGHALLEAHYTGADLTAADNDQWGRLMAEQPDQLDPELYNELVELRQQAWRLMERYQDRYQDDPWEPLLAEEHFDVPLREPGGRRSGRYRLQGFLDLVVRDRATGQVWLVDHKFTGGGLDSYEDGLVLNDQANMYLWAARELMGVTPTGVIFNLVRTKEPRVPEVLKKGGLSKAKSIDTTYSVYRQAITDNGLDPNDYADVLETLGAQQDRFFRRVPLIRTDAEIDQIGSELYSVAREIGNSGAAYRNPTKDCAWDCQFRELCIMESKGLDSTYYRQVAFE